MTVDKNEQAKPEEKKQLLPAINLPKGGGAINGIGEKFSVNAMTGTGAASIPIPVSPARHGFQPAIMLSYDSGSGNSAFGLGWQVSMSSITRKTAKGLPQYRDDEDSDTFLLSGAEDLVPYLIKNASGIWVKKTKQEQEYTVHYYRPRTEGLFAIIERWVHDESGDTFWKSTSKENVSSVYGRSSDARIYDAAHPQRVFEWLLEECRDNLGNIITYTYKAENDSGIDPSRPSEQHRLKYRNAFNQKYIKQISYGNSLPDQAGTCVFHLVFDYGEHSITAPSTDEVTNWDIRPDPFSTYLPGFEVRSYRLCRRVLMFHDFEHDGKPLLVRSTDLSYRSTETLSLLTSARQTGYIRNGATYTSKSTAPVDYFYSEPRPDDTTEFIAPEHLLNLPVGVDGIRYHWVDLEGEGIDGILTEQAGAWFYTSNLGQGTFSSPERLSSRPSLTGNGRPQVQDIDSDGEKELVIMQAQLSGYYQYAEGEWKNYKAFDQMPVLDFSDPNLRFIDLNGDGYADILITEDDALRWFPSKAKEGYEFSRTVLKPADEDEGPRLIFSDPDQSIYLADMSGSGLSDLVRIRNKDICYWPNMGYGKFGAKVTMDHAPVIDRQDQFHQKNIRLTDVDGSGTTDLIYLSNEGVKLWFNRSGNSWSDVQHLFTFPSTDNISDVQVADFLGKGTPCLVWSSPLPGDSGRQLRYLDLMPGGKPWLLNRTVNNMGAETRVHYAPSTKFYLADKLAGKPWITRLPFPVHVVERSESFDLISGAKLSVSYTYHHGYYDSAEREFRGFGMVEQQDEERFDEGSSNSEDKVHFVPPIKTKSWFHTGAYIKAKTIAEHYITEYYKGDPQRYLLPDSVIEEEAELDHISKREAHRALRGQTLRTEVYSLDGTEKEIHPYSVSEINFSVRQVQPHRANLFAVYLAHPNESIAFHYERNPDDPRVSHSITLEVDRYGAVLQSAEVVYPRRPGQPGIQTEQEQLHVICREADIIHKDQDTRFYTLGIPSEQRAYEATGIKPNNLYFNVPELKDKLAGASTISYSATALPQQVCKRLLSRVKPFYWKQEDAGTADTIASWPILPHHTESCVFTTELINQVYENRLNDEEIASDGKYILKDGYWWAPTPVQYFKEADQFYLPYKTSDAWGNTSTIEYDDHLLLAYKSIDALGNEVVAEMDYRTLSPRKMIDVHGNIAEAISDALGMVIASTAYGKEENEQGIIENKGDDPIDNYRRQSPATENPLEDIVVHPEKFLQDASAYFYYDLEAWYKRQQPPQFISLNRQIHVSELHGTETSPIHVALGYFDGFGRSLQQKLKVEPGIAYISDGHGSFVTDPAANTPKKEQSEDRWLSSGRTVYNNKEKPYKQYEPFYVSGYAYEKEAEMTKIGVTPVIHYDPLMRVVRTDSPDGFFSKVEFNSWEVSTYDHNDTVKDSDHWKLNYSRADYPAEKKAALDKAALHYNTPSKTILDSLGRAFMNIGVKENIDLPTTKQLVAYTSFNITGQPLTQSDPRQHEWNQTRDTPVYNFEYVYDMAGNALHTKSIDAGESRAFMNVIGNPLSSWNSRNFKSSMTYDALHRPTEVWCEGGDFAHALLVEKFVYGSKDSGQNKNMLLLQHFDRTGLTQLERVSFKGEVLASFKQFCRKHQGIVDWNNPEDSLLETEQFRTSANYDALGRVMKSTAPDKSVSKPQFNFSGQLKAVEIDLYGKGDFKPYVKTIDYTEKGQREMIRYGNDTVTRYSYEEITYRLKEIHTTREGGSKSLQHFFYHFDPVGNITEMTDSSQKTLYYDNEEIRPHNDYTYDAFYQLTKATGREHRGQNRLYSQFDEFLPQAPLPADEQAMRTYTQFFEYDDAGNKLLVKHVAKGNNWHKDFYYSEESNRLERTESGDLKELYGYDPAGNMQNLSALNTMQWNYKNELTAIEKGETKAWYNYDSSGQRCRKVVQESGKTKVRYYIGGYEVYREYSGNTITEATPLLERLSLHISDDTNRICLVESKSDGSTPLSEMTDSYWEQNNRHIRYQYSNHLGSASLELDDKAQTISYEEYYPYGNTSYRSILNETPAKRYRYTGMERDEESGLSYHTARYYAPWLGRWLSPDPAGTVDGLNLYLYVNGNPVSHIDRTGYADEECDFWCDLNNAVETIGDVLSFPGEAAGAISDAANSLSNIDHPVEVLDRGIADTLGFLYEDIPDTLLLFGKAGSYTLDFYTEYPSALNDAGQVLTDVIDFDYSSLNPGKYMYQFTSTLQDIRDFELKFPESNGVERPDLIEFEIYAQAYVYSAVETEFLSGNGPIKIKLKIPKLGGGISLSTEDGFETDKIDYEDMYFSISAKDVGEVRRYPLKDDTRILVPIRSFLKGKPFADNPYSESINTKLELQGFGGLNGEKGQLYVGVRILGDISFGNVGVEASAGAKLGVNAERLLDPILVPIDLLIGVFTFF